MKKTGLFLIFLFCWISTICSQIVVNPVIDYPYVDDSGKCNIKMIIVDDDYTFVCIDYATLQSESWILISSRTKIHVDGSNISYSIYGWGYMENDELMPLELDRQYSVERDRSFLLVLAFPKISTSHKKITIRENIQNEFIWKGIHMDYTQNDSFYDYDPNTITGRNNNSPRTNQMGGYGTGFAISSSGLIVTDFHVIENARQIKVRGINGNFTTTYDAEVVLTDQTNDLAIIKIFDRSFTSLGRVPFVIYDRNAQVGDDIFVLGYPLRASMGEEIKLTNGIVNSRTGFMGNVTMYQISAPVQAGNSGGPLFDYKGDLIGVIVAKHLGADNVSYAIKSPILLNLIKSLDYSVTLNEINVLDDLPLSEKARILKRFIYMIEVY